MRKQIVQQLLFPIIDYADIIYQNTSETHLHPLNVVYNNICRFVLRCPYRTHHCFMYDTLNWLPLYSRRRFHWLLFVFKCIYFNYPLYLKQLLVPFRSSYSLRHTQPFLLCLEFLKKLGDVLLSLKHHQIGIICLFHSDRFLPFMASRLLCLFILNPLVLVFDCIYLNS